MTADEELGRDSFFNISANVTTFQYLNIFDLLYKQHPSEAKSSMLTQHKKNSVDTVACYCKKK